MLPVHQPFDQLVARHVLLLHQGFDAPLAREQQLHLAQVLFQEVLRARALIDGFRHGAYSTLDDFIQGTAESVRIGRSVEQLRQDGDAANAPMAAGAHPRQNRRLQTAARYNRGAF